MGLAAAAAIALLTLSPGQLEALVVFIVLGTLIVAGWRQKPGLRP